MITKIISALLAAAVLSAVLGASPCGATAAKHVVPTKAAKPPTMSTPGANLDSPSMDFSGARPMVDKPDPNLLPPLTDKNQFFDQTLR